MSKLLTFHFRELDKNQQEILSQQIGAADTGLVHDLLQDDSGFYVLVEEGKASDFSDLLEQAGIDPK